MLSGYDYNAIFPRLAPEVVVMSRSILLALCSLLLVAACGQKGPLFHPEPAPAAQQAPTAEEEENADE